MARALTRSVAWVSAAATCAGSAVRRSRVWVASESSPRLELGGRGEQLLSVVGQQPPEGVEVHGADPVSPGVALALRWGEC